MLKYDIQKVENFSEKGLSLICDLHGYFFETFYRKVYCATRNIGLYSQQCLSLLMTGKCVGGNVTLPEHKNVDIIVRGGLWKVNENFTFVFEIAERYYRIAQQKKVVKIVSKSIVSNLMVNDTVLDHVTVSKNSLKKQSKKKLL